MSSISPFIFLPTKIIESIETALKLNSEELVNEAEILLNNFNSQHRSRLTLTRINNYLRIHASKCRLSQAEVAFISNAPLNHHGGSSYLSMSSVELTPKHYKYINTLMTIAGQDHHCLDAAYLHPIAKIPMGSNFSVPEKIIKSTIEELKLHINEYQKYGLHGNTKRWCLFNCYTYYTLILLNMCTGHRPTRNPYGQLSNFDLSRKVVFIADKMNREESGRIVPLNASALKQVEQYVFFLSKFVTTLQYIDPDAASVLHNALKGQEGLFYLSVNESLKPFSYSLLKKCGIPVIQAKSNWNRHWIRSSLALSIDLNPTAIDSFMGHENLLDESFSSYSTLDMSEIRKVTEAIQHELCMMEIEPLEMPL